MRYAALAASILSATVFGACSASNNPTAPSVVTSFTTPETIVALDAEMTAGGNARFAALRQATAAFHDVDKAIAAGYLPPTAECVVGPTGAMGIHAVNPALAGDQVIDPLRPEVLLYEPKPGGAVKLVGVEYFQAALVRNKATGAISPWFQPTPWSDAEFELVGPRPSALGQPFDGPMPGHEPGMPWHYDLHVWAWTPNPDGDFAPFNPRVSCGAAAGGHAH